MAAQTYASISALLAPRIVPRRTTLMRLFSVSATASSPSASLSLSTPPTTARPRVLTHEAKSPTQAPRRHDSARAGRAAPRASLEQAPRHDTGVGRPAGQQVPSLEISCYVRHHDDAD